MNRIIFGTIVGIIGVLAFVMYMHHKNAKEYVVNRVIPCTQNHVRHMIFFPQSHIVSYLSINNPMETASLLERITHSQKQIYRALIDMQAKVVFAEGCTSSSINDDVDSARIAQIKEGLFLLGNGINMSEDITLFFSRYEISREEFIYNRLQFLYKINKDSVRERVSDYKKYLANGVHVSDDVREVIARMDDNHLFADEIQLFRKKIDAKKRQLNDKIEDIKNQRTADDERLLRSYPYLSGGSLKLASEGKIYILPGEDSVLNAQAFALRDEYKKSAMLLNKKASSLEISPDAISVFFTENATVDLVEKAKGIGILSEYRVFVESKKAFEEMQEKREDFLVASLARYTGENFDVPVTFGANHDFVNNVTSHNNRHPDSQICLSRIEFR